MIHDKNSILDKEDGSYLKDKPEIKELEENLKSYGMVYDLLLSRGTNNIIYYYFPKSLNPKILNESVTSETERYLKDIFLELEDDGFDINIQSKVREYNNGKYINTISYRIAISKNKNKFTYHDIRETVL